MLRTMPSKPPVLYYSTMWILYFLKCYNNLLVWAHAEWALVLSKARFLLGADPEQVYLLTNGEVVSSRYIVPDVLQRCVYDPVTNRIGSVAPPADARYRPAPFLTLYVSYENILYGLDDWIGAVRCYNCSDISLPQLVALWATANHVYIPRGSAIRAMTDEGEDVRSVTV